MMYFLGAVATILLLCALYYIYFSPSSQVFGRVHYRFKPTGNQVALTFDDGPNEPYTSDLLALLSKHGVRATFFTCGECIQRHPDTFKNIIREGHNIGNHSQHHRLLHYLSPSNYVRELTFTNDLIKSITGQAPEFYRSPWLFRTPKLLLSVHKLELTPVWGVFGSELEVFQPSAMSMANRALSITKPGNILIFHDGRESRGGYRGNTVKAVDMLIPMLKQKGYSFVQVSKELLVK